MIEQSIKNKIKSLPSAVWWAAGYAVSLLFAVFTAYYYCVFYEFVLLSKGTLVLACCAIVTIIYAAVFCISKFAKGFNLKVSLCVALAGLLFCFVTPPLQSPDESIYYLRSYSISRGDFVFDANKEYPHDVNVLFAKFDYAWTNAHNGHPIKGDVNISNAFTEYFADVENKQETKVQKEPIMFMVLPFLPQAFGMTIARIFGFGALGLLYAGRIANLFSFSVLVYFALQNCKRYKPVFVAVALLPLTLFLAASLNYDSLLLGLTLFVASYYCRDEITDKSLIFFYIAVAFLSAVKINNILFFVLPLVLPKSAWKSRFKKWHVALITFGSAFVLSQLFVWYGTVFRFNYPEIGRMIEGVSQGNQLSFILQNPLRYCAVMLGTLYENSFFFFKMGEFGLLDLSIPVVSAGSACVLILAAALSTHEKSSLNIKSSVGLFALSATFIASVLTGLYITYTPVAMVRIIGLQSRYFIPAFLMLMILLSALLSHVLEPTKKAGAKAENLSLIICGSFAVISAILLCQHYYVGPNFIA